MRATTFPVPYWAAATDESALALFRVISHANVFLHPASQPDHPKNPNREGSGWANAVEYEDGTIEIVPILPNNESGPNVPI